jgi:hypothetical protein
MRNIIRRTAVLTAAASAAVGLATMPANAAVATAPTLVFDRQYGVCESNYGEVLVDYGVRTGDQVSITAGADIWSGVWFQDRTTPAGRVNEYGDNWRYPMPGERKFALLVNMDGGYRYAGNSFSRVASYAYDQTIKLRINDDVPNNGNGCFSAMVRIYR